MKRRTTQMNLMMKKKVLSYLKLSTSKTNFYIENEYNDYENKEAKEQNDGEYENEFEKEEKGYSYITKLTTIKYLIRK